jgi:peptidyl-prolyl cis-trans isomerase D
MFISKMNNLFHKHGRIAFGILTIVIIIPFVLYFSASPSDLLNMFSSSSKDSHVQMYGNAIPQDKLEDAITGTLITLAVAGKNVDFESMRQEKAVIEQATNRLRLLKVVDQRGLTIDDFNVAAYIREIPIFQVKGEFNVNMYKMFVTYYLGRYGINQNQFEDALRKDLLINMLKNQIANTTIVTDAEILQYYNNLNNAYKIQSIRFSEKNYEKDVKVTTKELKKFYKENRSRYLIPAKYKIGAVRFNFIKYKKEAEKLVTKKQIDNYYNVNKKSYKDKTATEAKTEIRKQLVQEKAESTARTAAQKFAVASYKEIESSTDDIAKVKPYDIFTKYAKTQKFKVYPVKKWITSDTTVLPRLGKIPEVTEILSHLYADQPISNAIAGKNAFFVICLKEKIAPRKANFNEVKDKVTAEYKAHQAITFAQNAAKQAYKDIQNAASPEKAFNNLNMKIEDIPEFSQKNYMPLISVKDGIQMYKGIANTEKGKVSKPVKVDDGSILIYVKNIKLPSMENYKKEKDAITAEYKNFKSWLLWYNYGEMLKVESNTIISNK